MAVACKHLVRFNPQWAESPDDIRIDDGRQMMLGQTLLSRLLLLRRG